MQQKKRKINGGHVLESLLLPGHLSQRWLLSVPNAWQRPWLLQRDAAGHEAAEGHGQPRWIKKGRKHIIFWATFLHELPPSDQYLNPVELFVCSLQPNVGGTCLYAKRPPVPGVSACEGAAPLLAEPHDGTFYPPQIVSARSARVSRYLIPQELKHRMSLVDFTGRRTCHELSDKLLLWQTAWGQEPAYTA